MSSHANLAAHGREAISKGSKSFALASLLFGRQMQEDVQMLYAWCRHCDDVIDGQVLGEDAPDVNLDADEQARRLASLKDMTIRALNGEIIGDPAFDGFARVARKHPMPVKYPMDLLDGFAMDVEQRQYKTLDDTLSYCYGVAGAVGIMMAIVMGVPFDDEETLDRACDLGLAFQLTNICRDIVDDAKAGRVYVPETILEAHNIEPTAEAVLAPASRECLAGAAAALLAESDKYYLSASAGVRHLPVRAAAAVCAARNVYRDIGRLVEKRGAHAWDQRVFTSKGKKARLAGVGIADALVHSIFLRKVRTEPRDQTLWQRKK